MRLLFYLEERLGINGAVLVMLMVFLNIIHIFSFFLKTHILFRHNKKGQLKEPSLEEVIRMDADNHQQICEMVLPFLSRGEPLSSKV